MSGKKPEKSNRYKLQPLGEVDVQTNGKNDSAIHNAEPVQTVEYAELVRVINDVCISMLDCIKNSEGGLNVDDLKEYGKNHTTNQTYNYFVDYLRKNKDNPQIIVNTISLFLDDFSDNYDKSQHFQDIGSNQVEILDKILNAKLYEEIDGAICKTMCEFAMRVLQDAGIEAAVLCGVYTGKANHTGVIYKLSNGNYAFNNYGILVEKKATNILDAAREIYKSFGIMGSGSTIMLMNGNSESFIKYAFDEEAAYGNEIDKSQYNTVTPKDIKIGDASSVKADFQVSATGNLKTGIGGNLVFKKGNDAKELSAGVEFRDTKESPMFYSSQSVGAKLQYKGYHYKKNNKKTYFDTKAIFSSTEGNYGGDYIGYKISDNIVEWGCNNYFSQLAKKYDYITPEHMEELKKNYEDYIKQEMKYFCKNLASIDCSYPPCKERYNTAFFRGATGVEKELVSDEHNRVTNDFGVTSHLYGTYMHNSKGFMGDARLSVEDGITSKTQINRVGLENSVNVGLLADFKYTGKNIMFGFMPGVKLNASTKISYKSDNWGVKTGAAAYGVFTSPSKEYGVQGELEAYCKPSNGETTVFTQLKAGHKNQRLTLGPFNESVDRVTKMNAVVGIKKGKTSIYGGYTNNNDYLNSSRKYSAFTFGAKLDF